MSWFLILDPQYLILDTRSSILDSPFSCLDRWFSIINSLFSILVSRFSILCFCLPTHDPQFSLLDSQLPRFWIMDSRPLILDSRFSCLDSHIYPQSLILDSRFLKIRLSQFSILNPGSLILNPQFSQNIAKKNPMEVLPKHTFVVTWHKPHRCNSKHGLKHKLWNQGQHQKSSFLSNIFGTRDSTKKKDVWNYFWQIFSTRDNKKTSILHRKQSTKNTI
jgi:hypothetical protein